MVVTRREAYNAQLHVSSSLTYVLRPALYLSCIIHLRLLYACHYPSIVNSPLAEQKNAKKVGGLHLFA